MVGHLWRFYGVYWTALVGGWQGEKRGLVGFGERARMARHGVFNMGYPTLHGGRGKVNGGAGSGVKMASAMAGEGRGKRKPHGGVNRGEYGLLIRRGEKSKSIPRCNPVQVRTIPP